LDFSAWSLLSLGGGGFLKPEIQEIPPPRKKWKKVVRSIYDSRFLILTIFLLILILWSHYYLSTFNFSLFSRVFAGIFFGSLIYLLLGIVIGSIVTVYVPFESVMLKVAKHKRAGVIIGALMGLLVPVCTCGLLPIIATLIRQKMPRRATFAFMFSSPAANPIVFIVTAAVFGIPLAFLRMIFMIIMGILGGVLLDILYDGPLLAERIDLDDAFENESSDAVTDPVLVFWDIGEETLEVGKYYVFAVTVLAFLVTAVDQALFYTFFSETLIAIPIGLLMGTIFSLCPTSDPPIGKTFQDLGLNTGGLISFFLAGPLMGMAYVGMMFGYLRKRLIFTYLFLSVILILSIGYISNVLVEVLMI
jgi:uncharacterized membrane protein YraQ (UPF0718 family)